MKAVLHSHDILNFNPRLPPDVSLILFLKENGAPTKGILNPRIDVDNYDWNRYTDPINDTEVFEWKKKKKIQGN